jgi:hypothetical protein
MLLLRSAPNNRWGIASIELLAIIAISIGPKNDGQLKAPMPAELWTRALPLSPKSGSMPRAELPGSIR